MHFIITDKIRLDLKKLTNVQIQLLWCKVITDSSFIEHAPEFILLYTVYMMKQKRRKHEAKMKQTYSKYTCTTCALRLLHVCSFLLHVGVLGVMNWA